MSTLGFMREVIRANKHTGALAPSSPELAKAVIDMARLRGQKVIVEFGPGNGVFTEEILRRMDSDAHFMAVEINPEFVKQTRKRCPKARVIEGSAADTPKFLQADGHSHCDLIISGLPWTRFEGWLQDELLRATVESLRPGGRFITFAYSFSPHVPSGRRFFREKLPAAFKSVTRSRPIWKNFPPAVVFTAEKS